MEYLKKTLAILVVLALVFPANPLMAAFYPEPSEAMDQIMTDLGVNKDETKKSIQSTINVMDYKENGPAVSLTFVPASPTNGKEITAMATPSYFTGDPQKMYYTWYLKHDDGSGTGKDAEGRKTKNGNTDWNKDDEIDIEDYKIEAARLLARGTTEEIFDYSGDPDSDEDDDGYASVFGGEDQKGKNAHCYVKDIRAGVDYELAKKIEEPGVIYSEGEDEMDINMVADENWEDETLRAKPWPITSCFQIDSFNLSGGFMIYDHSKTNTWPAMDFFGDGVIVNGNIFIFWQQNGVWNTTAWEWIGPGMTMRFLENLKGEDPKFANMEIEPGSEVGMMVTGFARGPIVNWPGHSNVQERSQIVKFRYQDGQSTLPCPEYELKCSHVFPKKYYIDGNKVKVFEKETEVGTKGKKTEEELLVGDPDEEKFTLAEEKFWGTDPEAKDTNNDGVSDEQALTGLGMISFKWKFKAGDQVGVAIEGVTSATPYKDSSLKTMWGLSNNDFRGGGCGIKETSVPGKDPSQTIKASETDLNECLEKNFIDPSEGTSGKTMGIEISFSPQEPINDPSGKNSDELILLSTLENAENKSFVKYDWSFSLCKENEQDCSLMTKEEVSSIFQLGKQTGSGLDSVKLRLRIDTEEYPRFQNKNYLKVELQTSESSEESGQKSGKKKIIIPLKTTSLEIMPYAVSAIADPSLPAGIKLGLDGRRNDLCKDKSCSAAKHEIIGLDVEGLGADMNTQHNIFSWTIDGKPFMSGEDSSNLKAFFPVLKDPGSTYSVKFEISEKTGDAIGKNRLTLVREFRVEEPAAEIAPEECFDYEAAECRLVKMGTFIDPKYPKDLGKQAPDYSKDAFEAKKGSMITISPNFNFDQSIFAKKDADGKTIGWKLQWEVDGTEISSFTPSSTASYIEPETGKLKLYIDKSSGEKYAVSLEALYVQPGKKKQALGEIWGISNFYETTVEDSIEIEVVEDAALLPYSGPKKIMASLFAGAPEYLNFLFRIFLTLGLILFLSNLSLVMFPKGHSLIRKQ